MKKALEAPSNLVVLIMFIAVLAIIILLAIYFGKSIGENEGFRKVTDFVDVFKW